MRSWAKTAGWWVATWRMLWVLLVLPILPQGSVRALVDNDNLLATSFSVDLGNPRSESGYRLEGWADLAAANQFVSPSADQSKRFMTRRADNSIFFYPVDLGLSHRLIAEVEDGACDDSFQILVGDTLLYDFAADPSRTTAINAHEVTVPQELVTAEELRVIFRKVSADSCGSSPVYNVELRRL